VPRTLAFNEADVSAKPQFIRDLPSMTSKEIASADAYYGQRLACLQAVDEAIDTICQTLAKTGQLDNTYIVFASDNGFYLGEHRLIRGKRSAYETDTHVPLIIRGPGIAKGVTTSALAGNIDLAPTFADLVGAAVPKFIDGRSLAAILKSQAGKNWRQAFLIEHWQQDAEPSNEKLGAEITLGRKFEDMIPQYDALQMADSVFVQYVTGEREYYQPTSHHI
jgi:arylsulfatase A-like enzyme